jgi:hypothetical protein
MTRLKIGRMIEFAITKPTWLEIAALVLVLVFVCVLVLR